MPADLPVWIMLSLGLVGVFGLTIWMGFLTQNKDNGTEIKKNLGIVAGITAVLITMFAAAAYMYFSANINYLTPFLMIMTFVNLFLSLFATSAATLGVTYA
jgi:hypothetical protein